MLEFADVDNVDRGEISAAGPSADPKDPSNDPAHADQWDAQRNIRATLIRWLCVDPQAVELVGPGGIQVRGARIVGSLDLTNARISFGLVLDHCAFGEPMILEYAELAFLDLSGSYTREIFAADVHVRGAVTMGSGFHSVGPVDLSNSRIGGSLFCNGGSFARAIAARGDIRSLARPGGESGIPDIGNYALILDDARIEGFVALCCGFQSEGSVFMAEMNANTLNLSGSRFRGFVSLPGAKVSGTIFVTGSKFVGTSAEPHGFGMLGTSAGGGLFWQSVELQNGATLDLRGSSILGLIDDEKSWPQPGRLAIDGFVYNHIYGGPDDARSRLRWIRLESGAHPSWLVNLSNRFQPQPYRELARVLRNGGDEAGARQVLVAEEDARYAQMPMAQRFWGRLLKITIGYGHRPLLAIVWLFVVVTIGWVMVAIGARAGVMRLTWPETTPAPAGDPTAELQPLLYSLDVFLPFVNLHQEHYWWPDARVRGECTIFGRKVSMRGTTLRAYLWLQIIAGWLLSAIFIAGVTGLIRND